MKVNSEAVYFGLFYIEVKTTFCLAALLTALIFINNNNRFIVIKKICSDCHFITNQKPAVKPRVY
jgi:hypothetical protein